MAVRKDGTVKLDQVMVTLYNAIEENNFQLVDFTIKKNCFDINHVDSSGTCALNVAVGGDLKDMVKHLVGLGALVNNSKVKEPPLITAVLNGFIEMARILLNFGANVEVDWSIKSKTMSPLQVAVINSDYKMTKLLVKKGANVCRQISGTMRTALHEIGVLETPGDPQKYWANMLKIVKHLLQNGADVNAKDSKELTPLDWSLKLEVNIEIVKLMIKEGAEVKREFKSGTFVDLAKYFLKYDDPELTRMCLERGCNYSFMCSDECHSRTTTYHAALKDNSPEVVKVFWEFGCQVDLPVFRVTPHTKQMKSLQVSRRNIGVIRVQKDFIQGIKKNNLHMVSKGIEKGAVPKGSSVEIPYPLHYLAKPKGNHEIARILLENGVKVNKLNHSKQTCLNLAMKNKNFDVVKEALMFGSVFNKHDVEILQRTKDNQKLVVFEEVLKAFQLTEKGSKRVLKQIKQYCSDSDKDTMRAVMNSVDRQGRSLLAVALSKGHVELAEKLMKLRIKYL